MPSKLQKDMVLTLTKLPCAARKLPWRLDSPFHPQHFDAWGSFQGDERNCMMKEEDSMEECIAKGQPFWEAHL